MFVQCSNRERREGATQGRAKAPHYRIIYQAGCVTRAGFWWPTGARVNNNRQYKQHGRRGEGIIRNHESLRRHILSLSVLSNKATTAQHRPSPDHSLNTTRSKVKTAALSRRDKHKFEKKNQPARPCCSLFSLQKREG